MSFNFQNPDRIIVPEDMGVLARFMQDIIKKFHLHQDSYPEVYEYFVNFHGVTFISEYENFRHVGEIPDDFSDMIEQIGLMALSRSLFIQKWDDQLDAADIKVLNKRKELKQAEAELRDVQSERSTYILGL
ncbi:MAG: hypothetical protein KAI17_18050 [Thiotrichaceae bacterium]|nr:hypothetical protein [Thiotrichaceae bacterium]